MRENLGLGQVQNEGFLKDHSLIPIKRHVLVLIYYIADQLKSWLR